MKRLGNYKWYFCNNCNKRYAVVNSKPDVCPHCINDGKKKIKRDKLGYLDSDGNIKELDDKVKNYYYKSEWRFAKKFPFIKKYMIEYKLKGDLWVEQFKN